MNNKIKYYFSDVLFLIGTTLIFHSAKLKGSDYDDIAQGQKNTRTQYWKEVAFKWK